MGWSNHALKIDHPPFIYIITSILKKVNSDKGDISAHSAKASRCFVVFQRHSALRPQQLSLPNQLYYEHSYLHTPQISERKLHSSLNSLSNIFVKISITEHIIIMGILWYMVQLTSKTSGLRSSYLIQDIDILSSKSPIFSQLGSVWKLNQHHWKFLNLNKWVKTKGHCFKLMEMH